MDVGSAGAFGRFGRFVDSVAVRIVSLLPSATEIVYGLGLGDQLTGVTFECDEPASARTDKAVVVAGRDTAGMSPAAIDAYVRSRLAAGEDLYTLHADALAALAPDLILTQDLCRVCALPAGHVEDALDYLGCAAEVVSLDPKRLEDVLATILTVGDHTGARPQAERLVAALRRRLAAVADRVAGRRRPSVAVIEWTDPPFTAGHWVPDLVAAAGGRPVAARPGGRSEQTTWEQIAAARPEVVVVAPCGFHLDDAAAQAELVARELTGLPVWAIDADGLVVRPGPRLVDGVEALAAILHPDLGGGVVPAGRIRRIA
jgi:iron complex transport system substrate-binding protein